MNSDYEVIESDKGDLVGFVDTEIDNYNAFQKGSKDFPVDPNTVPLVVHTTGEVIEGYFPESIGGEEVYEVGKTYLSEQDSIFHLKSDQERWSKSVKSLLSEKREEVTDDTNSSNVRNAYTRPTADKVPVSEDSCRNESFDASTGWDWD